MTIPRKQIFIPGGYYHIYNRGHNKQTIFHKTKDYLRYVTRIKDYLEKHPVSIIAYCLMPNHIHLLLRQNADESIDRFIHRLHTAYTMYFNIKYNRVGSVFQGRFKARLIDTEEYLLHLSRYIHLNPLQIIQAQAQGLGLDKYYWSSYREYINTHPTPICKTDIILSQFPKKNQRLHYRKFVEEDIERLDQTFIEKLNAGIIPEIEDLSKLKPWA